MPAYAYPERGSINESERLFPLQRDAPYLRCIPCRLRGWRSETGRKGLRWMRSVPFPRARVESDRAKPRGSVGQEGRFGNGLREIFQRAQGSGLYLGRDVAERLAHV